MNALAELALPPRQADSYTLDEFRRFASHLVLEGGKELVIEPFQALMLKEHFSGAQETVIIIPKKNGKTSVVAAIALFHLWCFPDAECVIGAASRDQASILFKQAAGLVHRSALGEFFDIKGGYREIRVVEDKFVVGRIRVLAADAATADGVIPTLALVDELHRHPSGELYGVFRDGLGPRDGRMITISTAGATMESPLGKLRLAAHKLPRFHRNEAKRYNYACSEDKSFVLHEWCLDDEDDVDDMDVVKLANPASWHTVDALRRRHDSPSTTPWQWLRFACGIWTEGEEPWIEPVKWDRLADSASAIAEGDSVWIGLSIGDKQSRTDAVLVKVEGDHVYCKLERIEPVPSEERVPLSVTEDLVRRLGKAYNVWGFVYVSVGFQRSAELLEEEGWPMIEVPLTPSRLEPASQTVFSLVEEGRLRHDGDPVLRSSVLAGTVKVIERGWRFKTDQNASALLCLAAAAHQALNQPEPEDMGIMFI